MQRRSVVSQSRCGAPEGTVVISRTPFQNVVRTMISRHAIVAAMRILRVAFILLLIPFAAFARTAAETQLALKKLTVVGSALYVAAHPDDENTALIAYLGNERLNRTGYLSMTRGDGGQNLLGDEKGELLGVIRTQELLVARRIDGGEQFFTRALDFGFSKSPQESLAIWNHDLILA